MDRMDSLAKIIWNKSFAEVTEEESALMVRQYPFFSAGQFLHLKKLEKDKNAYDEQYQKAILYHHQPTTFHLFLNPPADLSFTPPLQNENLEHVQLETKDSDVSLLIN